MRNQEIDDLAELRRALGQPMPPKEILQRPFDCDPVHLQALARDLRYEEVQKDFLLYALPFCLLEWREDLRSEQSGCGAFVASLYPALVDGGILDRMLSPEEAAAVSSFMRAAILDEIDEQRGLWFMGHKARPYRWVRALTTYGVLLPGPTLDSVVVTQHPWGCHRVDPVHLMPCICRSERYW
jgi:hypothetical protein